MSTRFFLVEAYATQRWEPFELTRPVGELLFGAHLLRERLEGWVSRTCTGYLGRPELEGFHEPGSPPVLANSAATEDPSRPRILLSSLLVPEGDSLTAELSEGEVREAGGPAIALTVNGEVAGWVLPPNVPLPLPLRELFPESPPSDVRAHPVPGRLLRRPWELVSENPARLATDLAGLASDEPPPGWRRFEATDPLPSGVERVGTHPLLMGPGVTLDPGVVLELSEGPVCLGEGVRVRSFTLLEGPSFVGSGSTLLGGLISRVSFGPVCRVRGEVADSVILGYSNKAHDGHLGHAYLGRWVNLGAMTTNSDLKNNYGLVRVGTPQGPEDSGLKKVGCFLGDHVKTAIGTLVGTGTSVGAGSNLFGSDTVSGWVPPFSWGGAPGGARYDGDRFLETARLVMGRRGVELTSGMEGVLARAWKEAVDGGDDRR